ncbi:hypothetical protein BJV82DRAFT_607943 [Fennellomyces sp. T-0311]|nr:hypothetical protein BJV82DRAFT_607943 [Fennellomyces sp. T-0311]
MTNRQVHDDDNARSLLLFPIAFLHSHIYWFCSVIWTVCAHLFTEPIDTMPPPTKNRTTVVAKKPATPAKVMKRPRGFSAPPPHNPPSIAARERCTTVTAGMAIDVPARRPRRFLHLRHHVGSETEAEEIRPSLSDERAGTTCPPQWWQKTRFYIDALKHSSPNSSVTSLPDALDDARPSMESTESVPASLPTRPQSRRKRFLKSFQKPSTPDDASKRPGSLRRLWKKKANNNTTATL